MTTPAAHKPPDIEGLTAGPAELVVVGTGYRAISDRYAEMAEHVLREVRRGSFVCLAAYGHPGVFATPPHTSIAQARREGYPARMVPAASAEAWLYADLGIDPASSGCQSYEASDFLIYGRVFDPTSTLVLWQVGVIGMEDRSFDFDTRPGAEILVDVLTRSYASDHEVILYVASPYAIREPHITRLPLARLADADLSAASTLVIPPQPNRPPDPLMVHRLFGEPVNP